ncbi:MAG: C1 family peptidase [Bacteroidota bacterium]
MKKTAILLGCSILVAGSTFAQKRAMGAKLDREKMKSSMQMVEKPLGFGANLPKSATLEKYLPPVGDQGNFGTCVGWSTAYYASTAAFLISADSAGLQMPKEHAFDPFGLYNVAKYSEDTDCSWGLNMVDALIAMRDSDDATKKMNINPGNCGDIEFSGKNVFDITEAYYLYGWDDSYETKLEAICQQIVNKRPVVIGMMVPTSFFSIGADGLFKPNKSTDQIEGGHAMCLVGYDDNKFGGAFKVVNSWGTSWGEKGFFWIKYKDFFDYVDEAYYFESGISASLKNGGCVAGTCATGYGVQNIVGKNGAWALFEGYFEKGKAVEGIFYSPVASNDKKAGVKYINKVIKKSKGNAKAIYDGSRIAGFVLTRY